MKKLKEDIKVGDWIVNTKQDLGAKRVVQTGEYYFWYKNENKILVNWNKGECKKWTPKPNETVVGWDEYRERFIVAKFDGYGFCGEGYLLYDGVEYFSVQYIAPMIYDMGIYDEA